MTKNKFEKRYFGVGWDWYLETDEGSSWVSNMVKDHIERLESENEELRALVRKLLWGYDHDLPPADALVWWNDVGTQLRELGIEED